MRVLLAAGLLLAGCVAPQDVPAVDEVRAPVIAAVVTVDGEHRTFEPTVAVDPEDPSQMAVAAMVEGGLMTYASRDAGRTWSAAPFPGEAARQPDHPLFSVNDVFDPVLRFLPDGTLLLAACATSSRTIGGLPVGVQAERAADLFVARSADGGETWPDVKVLRRGLGGELTNTAAVVTPDFNDKPWLAVGRDGTVLLTWIDAEYPTPQNIPNLDQTDIWFAASKDNGVSWTQPALVAEGFLYPPLPAVLADGSLHIVYNEYEWYLASSYDGGATWTHRVVMTAEGPYRNANHWGSLEVQRLGDHERLVLVVSNVTDEEWREAILTSSDDGGAAWTKPARVAAPSWEPLSFAPLTIGVAADEAGDLFVTYFHRDRDAEETSYRVVAVRDHRASQPAVLEAALDGHPIGRGHYQGIAGLGKGAYAVWVGGPADAPVLRGASVSADS